MQFSRRYNSEEYYILNCNAFQSFGTIRLGRPSRLGEDSTEQKLQPTEISWKLSSAEAKPAVMASPPRCQG